MKIRGRAPLRVSFAGGGTDLNYVFEKYGGAVVSSTIDKYCHMTLSKRDDGKVFINGKELDGSEILASRVLKYLNPTFGLDVTYYNDLPPGSGLGSSSSFTVLMIRLMGELQGKIINDNDIVQQAYKIETSFKEGGWQDQFATAVGGFNFMEFLKDKNIIYPLRLKYSFVNELNEHLMLFYLGRRNEEDLHKQLREYSEQNLSELERTAKIKDLAFRMRDCLLNGKIGEIGEILNENWKLKRNKFTTSQHVDDMYKLAIENGAEGGKLCGSGKSGHFLVFVKPEKRKKLLEVLLEDGIKNIDFNFSKTGVETWSP